uniref:Ig-like domain-containing protein n=1 Tax=Anabas testudineus TaxID=64144 RepID=A0A3Q1I699_ANATE
MRWSVDGQTLIQSEPVVKKPGESHMLTCTASALDFDSYWMGWIRQREGKALDWILIMWASGSLYHNNALKNKFSCSRDTSARTVTLTGQNLQPEDTAVYYCARGPTVIQTTVNYVELKHAVPLLKLQRADND